MDNCYGIISKYFICDSEHVRRNSGAIVIDGKIALVGSHNEIKAYCNENKIEIYNYSECIIMPGFINAHTHMYGVYSHGVENKTESFDDFLADYWWPSFENRIREKHAVLATYETVIESLKSGVTCICDTLEAPNIETTALETESKILKKYGVKGCICLEGSERVSKQNGIKIHKTNINFAKHHLNDDVRGMICSHTIFTCSSDYINTMYEDHISNNYIWQFHLNESDYESEYCIKKYGVNPLKYLDKNGWLDNHIIASQCVCMSDEEIDILAERKIGVVHMPLSNCEVGGGVSPVPDLISKKICVALGSDGYINNYFEIMRAAFLFHKGVRKNSQIMPAKTVFKMATENGAKIMGFEKETGSLNPGMCADFQILRCEFPSPLTEKNIFDQIVLFGNTQMIQAVYTNGVKRFDNNEIINLSEKEIMTQIRDSIKEFWEEM